MSLRRLIPLFACFVVSTLIACGGNSDSPASTTGVGGSGGSTSASGGGGSDPNACPAGSHGELPSCSADLEGWSAAPPIATARDHHVTFAATTKAGSFLFVGGGISTFSILASVERAAIQSDGTLGPFAASTPLPEGRGGAGVAQIDNTVLLAGGLIASGSGITTKGTFLGTIGDDGSLSFAKGPDLVTDRYHLSMSTDRGFVYAIGGLRQFESGGTPGQTVSDAVERATFDGKTVGAFSAIGTLPHALTHQAAVVRDHFIYLFGGLETEDVLTDVIKAEVKVDGSLGSWEPAGSLPEGRATSSAFVFLDQVYVICGANLAQGGAVDTVLRASFGKDGSVGKFEELTKVPMARAHVHQTPFVNGFIYSAAGSSPAYENQVFVGKLE